MKFKSLLISTLLFASLAGNAQTFTRNWQKLAGDQNLTWLTSTTNFNSIAYNAATNKVYVPTRNGQIYIIDPATGDAPTTGNQTLSKTGITANTYLFNKIAVTTAGEIYAITSAPVASGLGKCVVWYWATETSDPVSVIASTNLGWVTTERAGDTFAVTGTGDNAVIYVSGLTYTGVTPNTGTNVQVFAKKDGVFEKVRNIVLDASASPVLGLAGYSIAPVTTGTDSPIWVSGKEYGKRKYSSEGVRLATLTNSSVFVNEAPVENSISKKFIALKYFEIGTKKYLAATGAYYDSAKPADYTGEEVTLSVFDITSVNDAPADPIITTVSHVASSKLNISTLITNPVPSADIAYKRTDNSNGSVTMQFFQIIGRNGFGSHTITFPAPEPLPVSLSSFNASVVNNQNQLVWSTASESNNSGFEIESSLDGSTFSKIGFVASKSINSNTALNYSFTDKSAQSGTTYYRLKQLDLDAKFTYSDVKVVNNQLSGEINIYPNPTDDYVIVSGLASKGFTVSLFNSKGIQLNTKELIEGDKVNLKGLTTGLYIINVSKNGKILQSSKIVKR